MSAIAGDGSAPRLRPMTVGDIIDGAFALYRSNFALFVGVVAVLAVPQLILNVVLRIAGPTAIVASSRSAFHFDSGYAALAGLSGLLGLIFGLLITGPLARVISDRYLGQAVTVPGAYAEVGLRGFLRLLGTSVIAALAAIAAVVVCALLIFLLVKAGMPLALIVLIGVLLGLTGIVVSVYVWVHLQFVSQAVVIEGQPLFRSFARSWQLVTGSGWRVLGIVLLVSIMVSVLEGILGGVVSTALVFVAPAAATAVSGLISILIEPFQFGASTLLYYDLRVRKEAFDLEHLAGEGGGVFQPA